MANGHGGKRPGAGRPRKIVQDWHAHNLAILREEITDERVRTIAQSLYSLMSAGEPTVLSKLLPYIFGPAPTKVEHDVDVQGNLRIVIEE